MTDKVTKEDIDTTIRTLKALFQKPLRAYANQLEDTIEYTEWYKRRHDL